MKEINSKMQVQLAKMSATKKLFRSSMTGREVWQVYLSAFADDPKFRDPESSEHNCNMCNNFIRRYGNIVAIDENFKIMSLFDFGMENTEYEPVVIALSEALRFYAVQDVFFETYKELNDLPYEKLTPNQTQYRLGMAKNSKRYTREEAEKFGVVKEGELRSFDHFYLDISTEFVSNTGASIESISAIYRSSKEVFQRAMETISLDTLNLVKDLTNQGSLLDAQTHLYKVEQMIMLKTAYDKLKKSERDNWCWVTSYKLPIAKFRNELIGTLCAELAEGEELNKAVQSWNKRVDPANYMKAIAPITKRQIEEAKKFVEENNFVESFDRRFATLEDIRVSEILHSNVGNSAIKSLSIFDSVKPVASRHKRNEFEGVEEVSIEKFMKDILPGCTSVEAYLTSNFENNMVTLTKARQEDSKKAFKWSNDYSWTYNGNLAGKSQIKENVKLKGGKVDGVLRFSMMWADGDEDNSDLDLHCIEPSRNEIYYGNRKNHVTEGILDVDIRTPGGKLAVENITFPVLELMQEGKYHLFVRQFSARNSKGFKAEIEFDSQVYSYEFSRPVSGSVPVAEVTLAKGEFTIMHILPSTGGVNVTKEIYGLMSNEFQKVNLVCLSPNHWGENNVGNKHYFFMLEGAKATNAIRSFHSENLLPELANHRKVFEVLEAMIMIKSEGKQLSGLGFNATVKDELIVRLSGSHKRVVKIKF